MNLKSQKGSITLFVLVSCLFFLASVACVNMYMQSKQVAVDREYRQIKANYEKDINNMEAIYTELSAIKNISVDFGAPKFDKTQNKVFIDVFTNLEYYNINTLKYGWYPSNTNINTPSINYITNWTYVEHQNGENEFIASRNLIEDNRYYYLCVMINNTEIWKKVYDDYIEDGMILHFDGINNAGLGDNNHDTSATRWTNLCEVGNDEVLYDGILNGPVWGENCLIFDGINDWVSIGQMNYSDVTIEAIVENTQIKDKEVGYVGNWQSGGYGLLYNSSVESTKKYQNQFAGYIQVPTGSGSGYKLINSDNQISINKKYILTANYDKEKNEINFWENGTKKTLSNVEGNIKSPSNNTIMALGTNPGGSNAGGSYLDGKIYSVRIYNRCLTDNEIKQNYNKDKSRFNIED